jgi:hypothetical protein
MVASPFPPLELKAGVRGYYPGKILKFYFAVGEFYSISEAINVVLVMGFRRKKVLVQL